MKDLADKIADEGLTAADILWIERELPRMSHTMTKLMVLLLILDRRRTEQKSE